MWPHSLVGGVSATKFVRFGYFHNWYAIHYGKKLGQRSGDYFLSFNLIWVFQEQCYFHGVFRRIKLNHFKQGLCRCGL